MTIADAFCRAVTPFRAPYIFVENIAAGHFSNVAE
jgi:hypothetical protein